MMDKFTKFNEWEKNKYSVKEEEKPTESQANSELLAQISELVSKRKQHIKYKEEFNAQILDIDIKLLQLEVEKNNLKEKRRQLEGAQEISTTRQKSAKTNA